MVKERLDPSLRIYIEYSNEVWNGQFPQSHHAGEQSVKLGLGPKEKPWEAGWHFTALRSMQIFQIWEDVFGGHDRLIRVLPTQSGNTGVSEGILRSLGRHRRRHVCRVFFDQPLEQSRCVGPGGILRQPAVGVSEAGSSPPVGQTARATRGHSRQVVHQPDRQFWEPSTGDNCFRLVVNGSGTATTNGMHLKWMPQ